MITKDKITEIFCIADDFCKEFELEDCETKQTFQFDDIDLVAIEIFELLQD